MNDGYDPAYGARPMRRSIQRLVQDPLALRLLAGDFLAGKPCWWTGRRDRQDEVRKVEAPVGSSGKRA